MIEINNLVKTYGNGEATVHALRGVTATIEDGECVAVIGKSGSGKSTLLNVIGGMDKATSGEVYVDGESISGYSEKKLSEYRLKKIGFIFQFFNLIPILTVRENILLPLIIAEKEVDRGYYEELVKKLGIEEKQNAFPEQLSGGQKQRVAIGRAMIHKPKLILADEPTGNLDQATSKEILELLVTCATEYNQTLVIVTHDMEVAGSCGRIIEIADGRIIN